VVAAAGGEGKNSWPPYPWHIVIQYRKIMWISLESYFNFIYSYKLNSNSKITIEAIRRLCSMEATAPKVKCMQ